MQRSVLMLPEKTVTLLLVPIDIPLQVISSCSYVPIPCLLPPTVFSDNIDFLRPGIFLHISVKQVSHSTTYNRNGQITKSDGHEIACKSRLIIGTKIMASNIILIAHHDDNCGNL